MIVATITTNFRQPIDPFETLGVALDAESWNWISETLPEIASAVQSATISGASPDDIRRFVAGHTQRYDLARRCEQAARHLLTRSN